MNANKVVHSPRAALKIKIKPLDVNKGGSVYCASSSSIQRSSGRNKGQWR